MNKVFSLLLSFCTFSILCIGQITTEGLVGYFPFNGTTHDESGNGNNLFNIGAALTTDKNDLADNAFFFDNSAIITAPDSNMFSDLDSSFSISLSYNSAVLKTGWPTLINKLHTVKNVFSGFYLGIDSSRNILRFRVGSSYIETPSALNQWQHVVISFGNDSIKLYLNGNLKKSKKILDVNQKNEANLTIGKQSQDQSEMDGASWFTGKIDDIRIYKRVLTPLEILELYYDFSTDITHSNAVNSINIYPNPAKDHFTINMANVSGWDGYNLKITNSLGQIVHKSVLNQQYSVIDLPSNRNKGIYFVYIIDPQSQIIFTRKLIHQ